jgi:hypothetical protein
MDLVFATSDGGIYRLREQATLIGENLRLFGAGKFPKDVELVRQMGAQPDWLEAAIPLADAIEEVLVDRRRGPLPVEGKDAKALYWASVLVTNPARDLAELRDGLGVTLGYVRPES